MAAAMGISNPTSGRDFIAALDKLISDVGCNDLTADPLPLSDDDYLTIFENAWR